MKVFVTGGAGFLGINLIRSLQKHGAEEIASYDIADFDYPERDVIRCFKNDIRDMDTLRKAMQGYDCVVHCAAALPLYSPEDIRTTMTEFFKKYVPGFVKENLGQYVSITGGKVVVNGTGLTETQRDDLTTAFKETFFIRFPRAFPKLSAL